MVIRAQVPEHIEIQGRRANNIKHSASWEATQVFLEIFLSLVQFLLSVLSLCWFAVSVHNRNPFLDVYFQDPRLKVLGRIRSCSSLQKFERVTYCTRGVLFYLKPLMNILHFGSSLSRRDVAFQRHDVSKSRRQFVPPLERRDVGSQHRDVDI